MAMDGSQHESHTRLIRVSPYDYHRRAHYGR
jgi:hypothetical protein